MARRWRVTAAEMEAVTEALRGHGPTSSRCDQALGA